MGESTPEAREAQHNKMRIKLRQCLDFFKENGGLTFIYGEKPVIVAHNGIQIDPDAGHMTVRLVDMPVSGKYVPLRQIAEERASRMSAEEIERVARSINYPPRGPKDKDKDSGSVPLSQLALQYRDKKQQE